MTNLTPVSSFDSVPQLETTTQAKGGPGGPVNQPAQALLNRTQYLNDALAPLPGRITNLEVSQGAGMIGYATKALMDADLAHADGVLALVTNDATSTNNGAYRKSGASGAGSWVLSTDRITIIDQDLSGYRAAGKPVVAIAPLGMKWAVADEAGNAAFGVMDDGTVWIAAALFNAFTAGGLTMATVAYPGFAAVWCDASGNAAFGIHDDGSVEFNALKVGAITAVTINGKDASAAGVNRNGGVYSHQINFINNTGQSLGEGSTPATAITTAQEYDNVGFPAQSTSPIAFVPLTVANTQVGTRGESPMYGALGHIKELIAEENDQAWGSNGYQLAACNNAYSGFSITALNKGTAPYTAAISQVTAGNSIAIAAAKTFAVQAVLYTQGEADTAMARATYKGYLKQLAIDYNTDCKAITGQGHNVVTITYQCGSASREIALAQLECNDESDLIVMACPMYQFTYGDIQHVNAASSQWLGGYYGLAYKRVCVDRVDWQPLKPVQHAITGTVIDLFFNKNGLVLDTTLVPAQVNSGFQVLDGASASVTISSVAVISPNRVRITCATAPSAGWTVRYGFAAAIGRSDLYVGGCGNLRDSQGDTIVYKSNPMHNWCVIFSYAL